MVAGPHSVPRYLFMRRCENQRVCPMQAGYDVPTVASMPFGNVERLKNVLSILRGRHGPQSTGPFY